MAKETFFSFSLVISARIASRPFMVNGRLEGGSGEEGPEGPEGPFNCDNGDGDGGTADGGNGSCCSCCLRPQRRRPSLHTLFALGKEQEHWC